MGSTGKVYLVGAGPGDAGLLTLRGAELLRRAEVIVYDALVNRELLALAVAESVANGVWDGTPSCVRLGRAVHDHDCARICRRLA